jgi:predicted aspartyl protease
MKKINSVSDKRLIIEGRVNDKTAYFLIDTGASLALMDYDQRKKYDLEVGKRFHGNVVGAGGEMRNVRYCNTFVHIENKVIPQFLLADISGVVTSIKRETGIEILGIISLPQMKMCGISLDCNDNLIIIE